MNPLRNPNINCLKGWFFVTMQVAQNQSVFGGVTDIAADRTCGLSRDTKTSCRDAQGRIRRLRNKRTIPMRGRLLI